MKPFLGLGPFAWASSVIVHIGLAGGYALAPETGVSSGDAPLVIELVMEDPAPVVVSSQGAIDETAQADQQVTSPPLKSEDIAAPQSVEEIKVAVVAPQEEFPTPPPSARNKEPAAVPVPVDAPLPVEVRAELPEVQVPVPVTVPDVPVEIALAPPEETVAERAPVPIVATPLPEPVPEQEPVVFRLPREKPEAPERPLPVVQEQIEPAEPVAELTLDQIASAAIQPVEETPVAEPESEPVLARELALSVASTSDNQPVSKLQQVASAATPVFVRANRMHEVADPVAVARVKGRGSFRGARALPVGSVNPRPKYPYSARKRGHEGRVVLHVQVSANGEPLDVSVVHSTGYRALDAAARSAVLHWKFEAARRAGVRIAGTVVTPIVFKLEN